MKKKEMFLLVREGRQIPNKYGLKVNKSNENRISVLFLIKSRTLIDSKISVLFDQNFNTFGNITKATLTFVNKNLHRQISLKTVALANKDWILWQRQLVILQYPLFAFIPQ